jgi:hypothetical protein
MLLYLKLDRRTKGDEEGTVDVIAGRVRIEKYLGSYGSARLELFGCVPDKTTVVVARYVRHPQIAWLSNAKPAGSSKLLAAPTGTSVIVTIGVGLPLAAS